MNKENTKIKNCWIISSGLIGCENQCLGITERMGIKADLKRINPSIGLSILAPYGKPIFNNELTGPWPDMAISAGRRTVPYLRYIRKKSKKECKTIYLQDPKINSKEFDIVWAPSHDRIEGNNVIKTITSPNRVSDNILNQAHTEWKNTFSKFSKPLAGFLIGGVSKAYSFDDFECNKVLNSINIALKNGWTPLITLSRRTPKHLANKIRELLKNKDYFLFDGDGPNPYFAILKFSDVIILTPDSANMISEALAVPKPIYFIDMKSNSKRFEKFIISLVESNHIKPLEEKIEIYENKKLDATQEVVDYIYKNLF